jgi:hypothetical protein
MPGHAKSLQSKKKEALELKEKYTLLARDHYRVVELPKDDKDRLSYLSVCRMFETQCFQETKQKIHLDDSTLQRRVKNGRSHAEAKEGG